jgi:hypothetical protein
MWNFRRTRRHGRVRSAWIFGVIIAALSLLDVVAWASLWNAPNAISNVLIGPVSSPLVSQAAPAFAERETQSKTR